MDVPELKQRGWTKIDFEQGVVPHAEGNFNTGDGKLAFYSTELAKRGLDPVPTYEPPAEVTNDTMNDPFPFALLTPKTHFFLNTTFANQSRQRTAQGDPAVVIHPEDAKEFDIEDGQRVRIWNNRGEFHTTAEVSDDAIQSVLIAPMGWWATDDDSGQGPQATTSQLLTQVGNAPTFNDARVGIEPA